MEIGGHPATLHSGAGKLLGNTEGGRVAEAIISTRAGGARRGSPGSGVADAASEGGVRVGTVAIASATLRVWRCCNIATSPMARKSNPIAAGPSADPKLSSRYLATAIPSGMMLPSGRIQTIQTGICLFFAFTFVSPLILAS